MVPDGAFGKADAFGAGPAFPAEGPALAVLSGTPGAGAADQTVVLEALAQGFATSLRPESGTGAPDLLTRRQPHTRPKPQQHWVSHPNRSAEDAVG